MNLKMGDQREGGDPKTIERGLKLRATVERADFLATDYLARLAPQPKLRAESQATEPTTA